MPSESIYILKFPWWGPAWHMPFNISHAPNRTPAPLPPALPPPTPPPGPPPPPPPHPLLLLAGDPPHNTIPSVDDVLVSAVLVAMWQVDGSTMCVAGDGLTKGASKFLKDDVLAVMRENQRVLPALKWQYYSSEEGVLFTYPALHFCEGSPPYDPRFR